MIQKYYSIIILVLGMFGLSLSVYLAYQYSLPHSVYCVIGDLNSCQIVRESPYSLLFGIKLPYFGILYFIGLIFLLFFRELTLSDLKRNATLILVVYILAGFLFELRMTLIQLFVIKSLCIWCTAVFLTVLAIALLTLPVLKSLLPKNPPEELASPQL